MRINALYLHLSHTCTFTLFFLFFFFNDTATTEIYTLSLHDALPISFSYCNSAAAFVWSGCGVSGSAAVCSAGGDRKSTRLNSSHPSISYAVFCLKKKNTSPIPPATRHAVPHNVNNEPRTPPPHACQP